MGFFFFSNCWNSRIPFFFDCASCSMVCRHVYAWLVSRTVSFRQFVVFFTAFNGVSGKPAFHHSISVSCKDALCGIEAWEHELFCAAFPAHCVMLFDLQER